VVNHLVYEPLAITDALCRYQSSLRFEAVQNIFEAFSFFANEIFSRNLEAVEK